MADTITLQTSDDPPVLLSIPRSALLANSLVFRNMLEDTHPSVEGAMEPITLSEKADELKLFLGVLQGKQGDVEMEELGAEQWEMLARLADKYDSPVARAVVQCRIWKDLADDVKGFRPFSLSILLRDTPLINRTAKPALAYRKDSKRRLGAGEEWREKLYQWTEDLRLHACVQAMMFPHGLEGCDTFCLEAHAVQQWHNNLSFAVQKARFDPLHPFRNSFRAIGDQCRPYIGYAEDPIDEYGLCGDHLELLLYQLDALERQYFRLLPPFPM